MVVIRCTSKLLNRLKVCPTPEPTASTTRLGDWYGNVVRVGRKQFILAVSEATLLPVVLEAAAGKEPFSARLAAAVRQVLAGIGVAPPVVQAEIEAMATAIYAPTASRRVLGSMNDFWNLLDGYWEPGADLTRVALRIAEAPCSPLGMESPTRATLALLKAAGRVSANDS
jgi:hypothetical protein